MKRVRFCILGAGPSGLAFAASLLHHKCDSFIVIEEQADAGGLCRTASVDGAPLDTGGGHFLDVSRPRVLDFLFRYLPHTEWREYHRIATVRLHGTEVLHPLEGNLWQLSVHEQIDFLEALARAGCTLETPEPTEFESWIPWKVGDRIAEEFLLPYNRKLWCMSLSLLGVDWMHKLPSVAFRESLRGCLRHETSGVPPAHARFLYPRANGYGEVWRRIADSLGDRLVLGHGVKSIDLANRTVDDLFQAEVIVNTIPWPVWKRVAGPPESVQDAIDKLMHVAIHVDYHPENLGSVAHWIYEPDERLPYHRQVVRHNFCVGARGHWVEANAQRSGKPGAARFVNEYAYPASTTDRPRAIATILEWARRHGVRGLGRWGTWEHINSDVAVERAMTAAQEWLAG